MDKKVLAIGARAVQPPVLLQLLSSNPLLHINQFIPLSANLAHRQILPASTVLSSLIAITHIGHQNLQLYHDDDDDDGGVYLKAVNINLRANLQIIKSVNLKYL